MAVSLPLLLILALGGINAAQMSDMAASFRKSYKETPTGVMLLHNVFKQVMGFECERKAADCVAWRAVMLFEELSLANEDCITAEGETPSALCTNATALLERNNDGETVEQGKILQKLFELGKKVNPADYTNLNNIRNAVVSYICSKEASNCSELTRFVILENLLESEIAKEKETTENSVAKTKP